MGGGWGGGGGRGSKRLSTMLIEIIEHSVTAWPLHQHGFFYLFLICRVSHDFCNHPMDFILLVILGGIILRAISFLSLLSCTRYTTFSLCLQWQAVFAGSCAMLSTGIVVSRYLLFESVCPCTWSVMLSVHFLFVLLLISLC